MGINTPPSPFSIYQTPPPKPSIPSTLTHPSLPPSLPPSLTPTSFATHHAARRLCIKTYPSPSIARPSLEPSLSLFFFLSCVGC